MTLTQGEPALALDSLDNLPFGEQLAGDTGTTHKFTGKEHDWLSSTANGGNDGFDYFGARYYSSRMFRFVSPGWSAVPVAVPYANLTNPQTLNLYSMVADDPESFADLDGHTPGEGSGCGFTGEWCDQKDTYWLEKTPPSNQAAAQAQNQNPDPVQQVTQATADAKQKAIAEQNRPPTEQEKANTPVEAGKMGDAGVKAGLVVVGAEAAVAGVVVAAPTVATAVNTATTSAYVKATTALSAARRRHQQRSRSRQQCSGKHVC